MAGDKARDDALAALKKLIQGAKLTSGEVSELGKLALSNQKSIIRLKAAVDAMKPSPDKNTKLVDLKELDKKLRDDAMMRYDEFHKKSDELGIQLSKTGQQKWMLNNLISMTTICVEQHTGGKSGEAYESRRDVRLIHMALKGLKETQTKSDKHETCFSRIGMSRTEYEAKKWKAPDLILISKEADAGVKTAKELDALIKNYINDITDNAKLLVAGFAESNAA